MQPTAVTSPREKCRVRAYEEIAVKEGIEL